MPRSQKYRGLRRTANRRAIMDAAEELFGLHGFMAVSVDEVTARAGVAGGPPDPGVFRLVAQRRRRGRVA